MKILHEGSRYSLWETKEIELVGNYQIIDKSTENWEMPSLFDCYDEALNKFNKLENKTEDNKK